MDPVKKELLNQILRIKFTEGRHAVLEDFDVPLSETDLVRKLLEMEQSRLIKVNTSNDGNNYALSDVGRAQIKVVLTGGAYDLLHTGHIKTLKEAASFGDFLLVVVAKDTTVEDRKRKPIHNEEQRMTMLNELKIVDLAVIGNKTDHMAIVRELHPDIIAIGSDQDHRIRLLKQQLLDEQLSHINLVRLSSNLEGLSTTEVITEILERFV